MENLAVTAILHNTSNSNRKITQYQERKQQYFKFVYTLRARVSANLTVTAKVTVILHSDSQRNSNFTQ